MTARDSLSSKQQDALTDLQGALEVRGPSESDRKDALRDARAMLIQRYAITIPEEGAVTINLGGASPLKFLREADKIISGLYDRPGIMKDTVADWATDDRFLAKSQAIVAVKGVVPGSQNLAPAEVSANGWGDVPVQNLAVAITAYRLHTGGDMSAGYFIRGEGGTLHMSPFGLTEYRGVHNRGAHPAFAACKSLT